MVKLIKYLNQRDWGFTVLTAQDDISSLPRDETVLNEVNELAKIIKIPINSKSNRLNSVIKSIIPLKSGFLQRWLSAFLYIPDIRKNWLKPLYQSLIEEIGKNTYDCLLISLPPYSLGMFAAQMTREITIPVILDMRDPWTTNPYKIHPTRYHYKKDLKLELASIANIRYGISAYHSLIQFYRDHIPNFDKKDWTVIPNGYDEDDFEDIKQESFENEKFNIAFSGTFYSHINNPLPLFKAMARLNPIIKNKILFHHIGSTQINLNKMISKYKLNDNVKMWNYLPHKDCIKQLNKMDAFCFILDDKNKNSKNTIGGKVYEYLRLRKPILALAPENGEAAQLIKSTKSGVTVSPNNTDNICKILTRWIAETVNFEFIGIEAYNREKQARYFLDVINQACNLNKI